MFVTFSALLPEGGMLLFLFFPTYKYMAWILEIKEILSQRMCGICIYGIKILLLDLFIGQHSQ